MMFNVLDLFCGTGAISYGLKLFDDRFSVLGGIDADLSACSTAAANHGGGRFLCAPIQQLSPKAFADKISAKKVDLIVGGPPCQGFSSLRPGRGSNIDDPRNRLFRNFLEYVRFFEPTVFLMENVVGLVDAGEGSLLNLILRKFDGAGYDVDWRILNTANFGMPQKRERVLIVGVNRTHVRRPKITFPKPTHFFEGRVIGTRMKKNYVINTQRGRPALTVRDAISDLPRLSAGQEKIFYACEPRTDYQKQRRRGAPRQLSLHGAADHSAKMIQVMKLAGASRSELPAGLVKSGFSSCYSRMEWNEPATTITVKFTSPASSKCIHPAQDRAITPREAARLQGFDDSFKFCGTKTQIASQIGNAVPPLLGKALAPMLVEQLELA